MNVHPLVDKALRLVKPYDPSAFVGGGALRDYLFEKPIKDVDIFVGPDFSKDAFVQGTGLELYKVFEDEYAKHFGDEIKAVYEVHPSVVDWPVQLIQMRKPLVIAEQLARFDFGFCQIVWNGTDLIRSAQFFMDADSKVATYTSSLEPERLPRAERRAARFAEKFPEWRFVGPGGVPMAYRCPTGQEPMRDAGDRWREPIRQAPFDGRWPPVKFDKPIPGPSRGSEFFERTLG